MAKPVRLASKGCVTFACVRFRDQKSDECDIVPIGYVKTKINSSLKDFQPSHDKDFITTKSYYVYRESLNLYNEAGDTDLYNKAHVLHLGSKYYILTFCVQ